ncbi:hypothetical protein [Paucisalibacillus globulus]|uniref:hypothetical protein n=1 Tax=Paucisalibacillus globulus TaxID=351095 RepID=UPI00040D4AF1|nr:hypothetical protein [Paucisalibacillus globulus]
MKVLELKPILLIQIVTTVLALGLFVYLAITDNMVVAPLFFMSLSLCFLISGFRLYKKNRIVAQKVVFYIVGIILFIIALQDLTL